MLERLKRLKQIGETDDDDAVPSRVEDHRRWLRVRRSVLTEYERLPQSLENLEQNAFFA
jgi:hypothetical protein